MRSIRELVHRWGRRRRLSDSEASLAVDEWRGALGVRQGVRLERIRHYQVTNERGHLGCSLVGVVCDAEATRLYHTRALTSEDIVHELLHVAQPSWREEQVVRETERLLLQAGDSAAPGATTRGRRGGAEGSPLPRPDTRVAVGDSAAPGATSVPDSPAG